MLITILVYLFLINLGQFIAVGVFLLLLHLMKHRKKHQDFQHILKMYKKSTLFLLLLMAEVFTQSIVTILAYFWFSYLGTSHILLLTFSLPFIAIVGFLLKLYKGNKEFEKAEENIVHTHIYF